jgi:hypothetical protein
VRETWPRGSASFVLTNWHSIPIHGSRLEKNLNKQTATEKLMKDKGIPNSQPLSKKDYAEAAVDGLADGLLHGRTLEAVENGITRAGRYIQKDFNRWLNVCFLKSNYSRTTLTDPTIWIEKIDHICIYIYIYQPKFAFD